MYAILKPLIRTGMVHVAVRYAQANKKLRDSLYDLSEPKYYFL